ncbi:hypothetical protein HO173_000408 [Letharia columbiana]|uniref:Uncharacterized protein n=1 Tax=Letharia columbiana TaxID=112416 RepID=A0A8H6G6Z5_9LECA|nr:uncharacterized protein HO173_000408 [Letharia columbiana]KAF6241697.1 hypothetical protein HO173_000408 [Letharia columbiana]
MLNASSAKVVIVSGKHAQRFISDYAESLNLSQPQQMQLQSQEITFRTEELNGIMRRIYMNALELETVVQGYGWVQRKSMSGALKLASLFLGSMSFIHRFYGIAKAKDGVFEAIMKARKGEFFSLDSLSEAARDWLGRRGFKTTEDINDLVTIGGGTLGQPLHTLYCVLRFVCSRIPQNQPLATWKRPNITFGDGPLFSKRMQVAIANLWYRKIGQEQEKLRIQIQRRRTFTPALVGAKPT